MRCHEAGAKRHHHPRTPAEHHQPCVQCHVVDDEHVLTLLFASDLAGYPGWRWSVTLARVEGAEPTVLETELMPGDAALLAPEWVPWSVRLAEYRAAQEAAAAAAAEAGGEADEQPGAEGGASDVDEEPDDAEDADDDFEDESDDEYEDESEDDLDDDAELDAAFGHDDGHDGGRRSDHRLRIHLVRTGGR